MSQDVAAAGGAGSGEKVNFFRRIVIFFREVIAELRKVVTPTRKELVKFTSIVLGFVIVMIVLVLGFDTLFSWIVDVVFGIPK